MQTFKDTETGEFWQFEDGVIVRDGQFFAPHTPDAPMDVPETLVPAELPAPPVNAPPYPQLSALEMLGLFTEAEQLAVVEATMGNAAVKLWYDRMIAATFVTYEDPRTEGGLQALVDAQLLTPERKAAIVAAMQPPEAA